MGYFSGKDIEDEETRDKIWRKVEDMMEKYGIEMDFFDYQREYLIDLILADPVRNFVNDGNADLDSGKVYINRGLRSEICVYDDKAYNCCALYDDCFGFKPFSESIVSIENMAKESNMEESNYENNESV